MKKTIVLVTAALLFAASSLPAVTNRIQFNGQDLFLNGANLAWRSFANDIGPTANTPDTNHFASVFSQIRANGGNSLRLWLHTTGQYTPAWSGSTVTGPGSGTIADLQRILDIAWANKVGVIPCLWSFDMLRTNNGATINNRARNILTNAAYRGTYITNALIPMVQALQGHPAIIAWEIFNEPEGMSHEFGWDFNQHVPMSAIQAFINQCSGAIHRTDPEAKVSNGSWSFYATTDVGSGNYNYYTDARLIAAGGDPDGYLDFYMVHYYDWAGTDRSPFHHPASYWNLDKPLVVAEFFPDPASPNPCTYCGSAAYENLYQNGYAGALAWSWTDVAPSRILTQIAATYAAHPADVLIVDSNTPVVTITSPTNGATFADGATVSIEADASDPDGTVSKVEFFQGATKLGEDATSPYEFDWVSPATGSYQLFARVTDNDGVSNVSPTISITVGTPPVPTRYEAEDATFTGTINVGNDGSASGGQYLNVTDAGNITFNITGVPAPGSYAMTIGFRLFYDTPKTQNIIPNGGASTPLVFSGSTSSWLTTNVNVTLNAGNNTILIQRSWGWMYFDYIDFNFGAANLAPTNIALSNSTIPENQPANTVVGSLSTADPNSGNTFTYSLVSGAGSADNASFNISGSSLRTAAAFNYESKSSYGIRVRSTDQGGLFFEKQFTITVSNTNEAPTDVALSVSTAAENQPANTVVGNLSSSDPDAGNTFTYTLVSGTGSGDNDSFNINGSSLRTSAAFDFEIKSSYSVRVRSADQGGLFTEKAFAITVTNVNETPTDVALSNATVDENQPADDVVGALSTADPDAGNTFTYTLVSGTGSTDNTSFNINGNSLRTSAALDFETESSYSVRVRSTDQGSLFTEKVLTINVTGVNEPPVLTFIPDRTIDAGVTLVITNSATDAEVPSSQTFAFSLLNNTLTNATLTASNGVFTWRPTVSQADTTNVVTMKVADSGSPSLSDTNSFNIIVNPLARPTMSSITAAGGQVSITANGPVGPDYTLLTSTNLTDWQVMFTTNSPAMPFVLTDTNLNGSQARFYRIQIGP